MAGWRNAGLASLLCLAVFISPTFAQAPPTEKPVVPPPPPVRAPGPYVLIAMDRRKLTLELFPDAAPKTVARFTELVKKGFYNGLTFYRILPKFLIQGGDPTVDGMGGSGQKIPAEFNDKKHQL